MSRKPSDQVSQGTVYDYVIIGSGFGGSVSAMRLSEKGYSVLVLERGKRFRDQDFASTNWKIWKYLWMPALRCFGVLQLSAFRDVFVLHGAGVGGGSLGYANVLMQPSDEMFANPSWKHLADWKRVLQPYYESARRMLGVTESKCIYPADMVLKDISVELGSERTFRKTEVGVFFGQAGKEGQEVPDPYFNGEGPPRRGCTLCGACMVGCRENAKNTLEKNYLYFAEKWGSQIFPECEVRDVRPLPGNKSADGARYEVLYRQATGWLVRPIHSVRARNVIFSAGTLGTLKLLFRCRDVTGYLPRISQRLGSMVRNNSEALLGSTARDEKINYSQGVAITSIFYADPVTTVEPVRYPAGSSLMRMLTAPLFDRDPARSAEASGGQIVHFLQILTRLVTHPLEFFRIHIQPGWAQRTTILLVMQTEDNRLRMRLGRSPFTLFLKGLISEPDRDNPIPRQIDIGHWVTRRFAAKIGGIPAGSINEGLLNIPMTAHILGGCPFGRDDQEGVIDLDCQVHNYPGLYVVDGSIMPANPGVNPSLTITALAEYAMSRVEKKADVYQ